MKLQEILDDSDVHSDNFPADLEAFFVQTGERFERADRPDLPKRVWRVTVQWGEGDAVEGSMTRWAADGEVWLQIEGSEVEHEWYRSVR